MLLSSVIFPEVAVADKFFVSASAVKSFANFCTAPSVSLRAKTAAAYSSSVVPVNDVHRADLIASL